MKQTTPAKYLKSFREMLIKFEQPHHIIKDRVDQRQKSLEHALQSRLPDGSTASCMYEDDGHYLIRTNRGELININQILQ